MDHGPRDLDVVAVVPRPSPNLTVVAIHKSQFRHVPEVNMAMRMEQLGSSRVILGTIRAVADVDDQWEITVEWRAAKDDGNSGEVDDA